MPELAERAPGSRAAPGSRVATRSRRASGPRGRPRGGRAAPAAAERLPVARVAVDVSLPHLDRPFDYLVPERLAETAIPGCRVRVRFASQLVDGYLLSREAASEHAGRLAFLERVVSPEPVLAPEIAGLARAVADRYAGTLADVLRLAIPPRHAGAESARPDPIPAPGPRPRRPGRTTLPSPLSPRRPAHGPATRRARRSWPVSRQAARSARPGRPCPARSGPRKSPAPPPRPLRPAAAP